MGTSTRRDPVGQFTARLRNNRSIISSTSGLAGSSAQCVVYPPTGGDTRFRWTEGSIAFWDNRAVQHYAASDYYPHKRVLRRVTLRGDRPYFRP